jgi:hypothetical protein
MLHHVTVTPDASKIAVFSKGICRRLNGIIPVGGHVEPNSIVGDRLLWKKAHITTCSLPYYVVFFTLLSLHPTLVEIFYSAPCSQTPSVYVPPLTSEIKFHNHT